MFFKLYDKQGSRQEQINDIDLLFETAKKSQDFKQFSLINEKGTFMISYYSTLINHDLLQLAVLRTFQEVIPVVNHLSIDNIKTMIPIDDIVITNEPHHISLKLLKGYAVLKEKETDDHFALINLSDQQIGLRDQNNTENEFSVVGPKIGFVENIDTNVHLLRQQINTPSLITKEISIGSMSHTKVVMAYIEGVTNEQHVETVEQRLKEIDFDVIFDATQLDQMMTDSSITPFPLFLTTERLDRTVYTLINGQVAIFCHGSPYAIIGPSTLLDFFISPEDYYLPWILGSFFRLIRILGVLFSVLASPIYIAVTTFHYEMIPKDLLGPLISSRNNVPFIPVLEVLFLEITIELLREAGARLPAKVGQTLGIVGGIVIGQAAVEASLTSNVLLIIVALSALASFTTPIFKMSNTIRFLRFPFIIFASIWGGLGIVLSICFLIVHLMRLQSLGIPYIVPIYPFRPKDFADSFIRSSYDVISKRLRFMRPKSIWRYHPDNENHSSDLDDE
ncbi:GerA family spore germination protein [Paenibacillus alvei TS-15]|uniref:GerA family spore germination protein n=1 Tax=Paenibacillus alvei TS-15 TaxID=1117108 RepID=S9TRP1_PAEAL|nr:spore germination protein [Paenibacillus alvei]EPY04971.1 GerA family spore germination protein [Paenibacillus alvei TS-15]